MAKWVMDQSSETLDYPVLGFVAEPNDILDASAAPDSRWSLNADELAAETVYRYALGSDPNYIEPTNGHVLTWDSAQNKYVPTDPAVLGNPSVDSHVADKLDNPLSAIRTTLDPLLSATIATDITAATEAGGAVWKVGPTTINVRQYGVDTTKTGAQNDAGLAALFADHTAGVNLAFPDQGRYEMSAPLPPRSNLGITGAGWGTILDWTTGSMLAPTTTLTNLKVSDIRVENSPGASHLINLGSLGGLVFANFARAELHSKEPGASIVHLDGGPNFFGNNFDECRLWRQPTHTVPAIYLATTGAGVNTCRWRGGWWHSQECSSTPFFRGVITSGTSYLSKLTFEDVIGEQNLGGMIHLFSANAARISNVVDHDALAAYSDDVFKVSDSGGPTSRGLNFRSSGTAGVASFAASKVHLRDTSLYSDVGRIINGGVAGTLAGSTFGRVIDHGGGRATSIQTVVANYTIALADDVVMMNSTLARTVTLPDPTALLSSGTIPAGRTWTVKNINTGALTVARTGAATIDGAASIPLAQWEKAVLITDGTNWYRL